MKTEKSSLRNKVAREAANLLYFGMEKEYRQAKLKASEILGITVLPKNREIAIELDKIAQETEGPARIDRLILMRKEALRIMKIIREYCPILLGSVWRGTAHRKSDIDIEAYHDIPFEVVDTIKKNNIRVLRTEQMTVTKNGKPESSHHITIEALNNQIVEVVIRPLEELGRKRRCEVFSDEIRGLKTDELEKVIKENPAKKFLPE